MRIGASVLLWILLAPTGVAGQEDAQHKGTFEEALEHHSFADLRRWRDAHPWSLGDRLATFLEGLLETRRVGERIAMDHADLQAAFLAESLAEDPFSGWILQVRGWDIEACSHYQSALEALYVMPEMIATGEKDAAWSQIADLRDHFAPKGGWALCAPALGRSAAAFLHAGDRERARQLASELASAGEELRQGSVLALCERLLGEIARETGDLTAAERRTSRGFEIRSGLDSGARGDLLDEVESLEKCELDTLLEIAIGEKETLVVAVGSRGQEARLVPLGRAAIEERVRRLLDPLRAPRAVGDLDAVPFDDVTARDLYDKLLRPVESLLGARIGIVPDGILSSLPFEMLVADGGAQGTGPREGGRESARTVRFLARDHAFVYLSRPPLGGARLPPRSPTEPSSGSVVIVGETRNEGAKPAALAWLERQTSGALAPVRSIFAKAPGDLAREAAGAERIHFEVLALLDPEKPSLSLSVRPDGSGALDLESLRGLKLRADLVVLANCRPPAKADAGAGLAALSEGFHGAGVRDVVASLWPVDGRRQALLAGFYAHLAHGERVPDAMRSARAELLDGDDPSGLRCAHPWSWAAWVVHRRF